MEFLIWIVIAFVFMAVVGVSIQKIIILAIILLDICTFIGMVSFGKILFSILKGRKTKGNFCRIDKHPVHNYNVAYYNVDEEIISGCFPSEVVMKSILYTPKDKVRLVLVKNKGIMVAFDIIQIFTAVIGGLCSSIFSVGLLIALITNL